MEEMISVNNLRKEFSYYKKGAGLQGSLNNLFHRQMLTKEAVKDVSFPWKRGNDGAAGTKRRRKDDDIKASVRYFVSDIRGGSGEWLCALGTENEFKRSFAIVMGQKISCGGICLPATACI